MKLFILCTCIHIYFMYHIFIHSIQNKPCSSYTYHHRCQRRSRRWWLRGFPLCRPWGCWVWPGRSRPPRRGSRQWRARGSRPGPRSCRSAQSCRDRPRCGWCSRRRRARGRGPSRWRCLWGRGGVEGSKEGKTMFASLEIHFIRP